MTVKSRDRISHGFAAVAIALAFLFAVGGSRGQERLDASGERWVDATLRGLSLEAKIGQLVQPSFEATYLSVDSDTFDGLAELVGTYQVGGVHVFGGRQPVPGVLLNPTYAGVTLGDSLAAAATVNRLQELASVPLLNSADFETGAGFRLAGATSFPRAMAFGAVGDDRLAYEAGRITAIESRALGVHVNFAPVVDVNSNPRNPVINTRSFGGDPEQVARLAAAYVRGLHAGGMLATLKHFPGHGDTDVDTHLGLAILSRPAEQWRRLEWLPFRQALEAGADAVMTAHIVMPAIDPDPGRPATLSAPVVEGVLRKDAGFDGLVYTDSMSMRAISDSFTPAEAGVKAILAGNDIVLHSPDPAAVVRGLLDAVGRGEISTARIDASVRRVLRAKAKLGLPQSWKVDLDAVMSIVGGRSHRAVATEVSQRAMTLIRDDQRQVPLTVGPDASILYLSVLDYPSGWGIAAPSRTFIPELKARWPNVTAIELSDWTSGPDLALVRSQASRYDAIVVGVFVRAASGSGRMNLAEPIVELLESMARASIPRGQPFVAVLFGNPYVATVLPSVPSVLLTYDLYDLAEASGVRALAGERPIAGRLPIELPGTAPLGHGLDRPATRAIAGQ